MVRIILAIFQPTGTGSVGAKGILRWNPSALWEGIKG